MGFKIGDEVVIGGKVIGTDGNLSKYPITVEFKDKNYAVFNEECLNLADKTYEQGLKDAWELAKKIVLNTCDGGIDAKELEKMFGGQDSYTIFKENDVKDALAKLETYEKENEIKVGDVVENEDLEIHIVTHINKDADAYTLINSKGQATVAHRKQFYKIGKNYGVVETILAEIGKE